MVTIWIGIIIRYACWLLLAVVLIVEMVVVVMRWQGYDVLSVQSDSMRPVLHKGDAIAIDRHARRPQAGQIIAFTSPQSPAVTISHRVVSVETRSGRLLTKGDAVETLDPAILMSAVQGTVVAAVPHVGSVLDWLRRPSGLVLAVYAPVAGITASELWRLTKVYGARRSHYSLHYYVRQPEQS